MSLACDLIPKTHIIIMIKLICIPELLIWNIYLFNRLEIVMSLVFLQANLWISKSVSRPPRSRSSVRIVLCRRQRIYINSEVVPLLGRAQAARLS